MVLQLLLAYHALAQRTLYFEGQLFVVVVFEVRLGRRTVVVGTVLVPPPHGIPLPPPRSLRAILPAQR